jgi:hypothetical protein
VQQTPGWLHDQIPDLFGLASALTGSAEAAADLVAQTIIRAPRRLTRQPAAVTADDDLLALLVGRFLATTGAGPPTSPRPVSWMRFHRRRGPPSSSVTGLG